MSKGHAKKVVAPASSPAWPNPVRIVLPVLFIVAALVWSYWGTIIELMADWRNDDNYSVGELVPFAALYLLWIDRKAVFRTEATPCLWGLLIILVAQAARAYGLLYMFDSAVRYSMVLTIVGLVLLVAGRAVFRQVFWILAFLFLMVPLPGRIHNAISGPLQTLATSGAVFFLELVGVTVARDGNVILLNDSVPLAVAEACSGLRMLTAFIVVGYVLAYVIERPKWQRVTLVVSTVPVAIMCNLVRLVVTAVLFLVTTSDFAERFFHDFAGLTMMPMAIAALLGELWILARLVETEPVGDGQAQPM